MSYIGNSPDQKIRRSTTVVSASDGQTVFTTAGYSLGQIDVYLNGVKLVNETDYTATDGSTFTLTVGAELNDTVDAVYYNPVSLTDGYTKIESNALFAGVGDSYTKVESDGRYVQTGDVQEAGAIDGIFWENNTTVTTDYTITANKNAGTFGPVTIADGVTVTIPDGSTWTVI